MQAAHANNLDVAAILVGGKGTRLKSVFPHLPKPLAPINGEPFLHLLLKKIKTTGIQRVVLLTGYGHDAIVEACGDGSRFGLTIEYSQEKEPLGTGGAIKHAQPLLEGKTFLLLNGDTFLNTSLLPMLHYPLHDQLLGVIGIMASPDTARYGIVECDGGGKILQFHEKDPTKQGWVNAGIYRFSPKLLDEIVADTFVSLETDVLPRLTKQGCWLQSLKLEGEFYDIGLPESYADFNTTYPLLQGC